MPPLPALPQGCDLEIVHVFSCELDPKVRKLLLQEHTPCHLFSDVDVFQKGRGFDFISGKWIDINETTCGIDVLLSGPVCTNLSRLNATRQQFAGQYGAKEEDLQSCGVSAATYQYGFKKARYGIPSGLGRYYI